MTRARPEPAPELALSGRSDRPGIPERRPRRRSRIGVLAAASFGALAAGCGVLVLSWQPAVSPPERSASQRARPELVAPPRQPEIEYPEYGSGSWSPADGDEVIVGRAGPTLRYAVLVETDILGVSGERFAAAVSSTLAHRRGWTAQGQWRFQRVSSDESHDFTIYLATPATRDILCSDGYDRYTSCRFNDRIVVNVARWARGVPEYTAGLEIYRQYVINHELGHWLGYEHELCPGRGLPAPVMQQQTLGLHGCVANADVVLADGRRLAGPLGEYHDPLPHSGW